MNNRADVNHRVAWIPRALYVPALLVALSLSVAAQPPDSVDIIVVHKHTVCNDTAAVWLERDGFPVIWRASRFEEVAVRTVEARIAELRSAAWVASLHFVPTMRSDNAVEQQRVGMAALAGTGAGVSGLTGAGVTVVMLDAALPVGPNFSGRLFKLDPLLTRKFPSPALRHATHVAGIIAGSGANSGPDNREHGIAPNASIVSDVFNPPSPWKVFSASRKGILLSTNSYSLDFDPNRRRACEFFGAYDRTCHDFDDIAWRYGVSLFVSPGNWRNRTYVTSQCSTTAGGYGTVVPFGTAKNVITVGGLAVTDEPAPFSPFGPTLGGRLKPDIMTPATCVISSVPDTNQPGTVRYEQMQGVSMAVPLCAGAAALMVEQYRKSGYGIHPGPEVVKAILLNCADDIDVEGPDYRTGYGRLNVAGAVAAVASHAFVEGEVRAGAEWTREISVEGGCMLKVMMVYNDPPSDAVDPAANPSLPTTAAKLDPAITNDLDLTLEGPSGLVLPLTLDPTQPLAPATPKQNRRDNVEQCVVANPLPGKWRIRVRGTRVIPGTAQTFAVTWCGASLHALYMRDAERPLDLGVEPNPDAGPMWDSPDIWVRNLRDSARAFEHQHQNPVYHVAPDSMNYVYVQVRNRGCAPASGWLRVYAARASTGCSWPSSWTRGTCCGEPCSGEITTPPILIHRLPPGETVTLEIPWRVPAPPSAAPCGADSSYFALLARIETSISPPFGLSEGSNTIDNARRNARVILKSVSVLDERITTPLRGSTGVRNPFEDTARTVLTIATPDAADGKSLWDHGDVLVELDARLTAKWDGTSKNVQQVGAGVFRILAPGGWFGGITLPPQAEGRTNVQFIPRTRPAAHERREFRLDVVQTRITPSGDSVVGAHRFVVLLDSARTAWPGGVWRYVVSAAAVNVGTEAGGRLRGTLGQPVIGIVGATADSTAMQGFWYPVRTDRVLGVAPAAPMPMSIGLSCVPNPVAGDAVLTLALADAHNVELDLYDALGNRVADIARGHFDPGAHRFALTAVTLPNGFYTADAIVDGGHHRLRVLVVR